MPTRSELMGALRNADAAGDTEAATRFAGMIDALPADEDYGNEGRRTASSPAQESGASILKRTLTGPDWSQVEKDNKDVRTGFKKAVKNVAGSVEDIVRGRPLFSKTPSVADMLQADKEKRIPTRQYIGDAVAPELDKEYKEAGPAAGVANFLGEVALTGKPSMTVGGGMAELTAKNAPKWLKNAIAASTAGAAGGSLSTPGEGESRAANSLQGAGIGMGVAGGGTALGAAGRYLSDLAPDAKKAAARTVKVLEKALGRPQMDSISANLDNPQVLPMTTAAASQSPGLAQIETQMRGKITPKDRPKWERRDEATQSAAWDELQKATGRAHNLDTVTSAHDDAWTAIQNRLNAIKIGPIQRQRLQEDLQKLTETPEFGLSGDAKNSVQRLIGEVANDTNQLGALAQYRSQEIDRLPMSEPQKKMLLDVIDSHLDKLSKGAWGKFQTVQLPGLERDVTEAGAANKVLNDFMSEGGVVRGRTGNEIPKVTDARLRGAINKQIADKGKLTADVQLADQDRVALDRLSRALQQAEYPKGVPAGEAISTGSLADSLGNLPTSNTTGRGIRALLRVVTGARDDAQAKALAVALRSPDGWRKIVSMGDKEISASDAKMLANILRASAAAGPAATSD